MSSATGRILLQGMPLACLILAGGLARQYASGAGVFDPAGGLLAQARQIAASVQDKLTLLQSDLQAEPVAASAPLSADALQRELAEPAAFQLPAARERLPVAADPFLFHQPAFGHCRH